MFGLKRQIEEKTEDYLERVAEARQRFEDEQATREQRERDVRAEVADAVKARYTKLRTLYAKQLKAWSFSVARNGTFLTLRWTDIKGAHAHSLNTAMVADIKLDTSTAQPPRLTGAHVLYNESRWEIVDAAEWWNYRRTGSYWTRELHDVEAPSRAQPAYIIFSGLDFKIEVPVAKAQAAYAAVLEAVS